MADPLHLLQPRPLDSDNALLQKILRVVGASVAPSGIPSGSSAAVAAVDGAKDKLISRTYEAGVGGQRILSITTSSASLGLSYTETYAYVPATDLVATITRS